MKKQNLVINTLVYLQEIKKGKRQSELLHDLKKLGVLNVEVRREFIETDRELVAIADAAKNLELTLFYSIPDTLFKNHRLDKQLFKSYIEEAKTLQAQIVKFNKGDYKEWSEEDINTFNTITLSFDGIVTVENDQTVENGKMDDLLSFYKDCQEKHISIYATFDTGNSLWVNEVPLDNAKRVKSYTKYIHLKDVIGGDDDLTATYLGEGMLPWKDIINQFSENLNYAIEYPCGDDPNQRIEREISKLLDE